ncbi:hypothetical protein UFOVP381_6 [uncultured Caudovirales phage]|uniref:Uncharacterized protein n=1 Tax=uncultured Caudovirales phage TaxID=2100421 RepID=A0A6J7WZN5_9CAUD|nr:hypothetical protein UFOVP381_6 [uncultured Caudovirales phage]
MAEKQVDPGIMSFAKGAFSGSDQGLRSAYQSELVNQLRGNNFQGAEQVWGNVQNNQAQQQQAQQTQQQQQINDFIATAPQQPMSDPSGRMSAQEMQGSVWAPQTSYTSGDNANVEYGNPMTIEQIKASGKVPQGSGQWQQFVYGAGGDAGGSYYAPYYDSSSDWASGQGG